MPDYVREQSVGELLQNGMEIYRRHFWPIVPAYVLPALPLSLFQQHAVETGEYAWVVVIVLLNLGVGAVTVAAITRMVSDVCVGLPADALQAYRSVLGALGLRVLVAGLLTFLAILSGFVLLIIPGIVLLASLMVVTPAIVLEGGSPMTALRRSWRLSRGLRLRNLAVAALLMVICFILVSLLLMPIGVLTAFVGDGNQEPSTVFVVLATAVQLMVLPLMFAVVVLMYYDARVRHENFDSAALAADLRR